MKQKTKQKLNKIILVILILILIYIFGYAIFEFNQFLNEGTKEIIKFCCNQNGGRILDGDCIKDGIKFIWKDCEIPSLFK